MEEPKLAVVIPTFNRAQTIRRAVDSVLASARRDFELVVVDDVSTDGTWELLGGIADGRLRTVRMDTHGHANRARNRGVASTTAPIVAFLDSDDEFGPDRIDRIIDFFPPHLQQQARVMLASTLRGAVSRRLVPTADGSGRVAASEVRYEL